MTDKTVPDSQQNYIRFRIGPETTIAMAVSVASPTETCKRTAAKLIAGRHPEPSKMEACESSPTDAMAGDPTILADEDYV